jgi:hypothetical protein
MDQFYDSPEPVRNRPVVATESGAEEKYRRAHPLAAAAAKVLTDAVHELDVGSRMPRKFLLDAFEPFPDQFVDFVLVQDTPSLWN